MFQSKVSSPNDYYLGVISSLGFVFGLIGNLIVLVHLLLKHCSRARGVRTKVTTREILVVLLGIVDLFIVFLHLSTVINLFNPEQIVLFNHHWYCIVWGACWHVAVRVSLGLIFLIALDLLIPLNTAALKIILALYTAATVAQSTAPFWLHRSYRYNQYHGHCAWGNLFPKRSAGWVGVYAVVNILEFLLPVFLTVAVVIFDWLYRTFIKRRPKLVHTQLSNDGTETTTDSEFIYATTGVETLVKPRSNTLPISLDSLPYHPAVLCTGSGTTTSTARLLTLLSSALTLPTVITSICELLQNTTDKQFFSQSFPPDLGVIKTWAVMMFSVMIVLKSWVHPWVFVIAERRAIVMAERYWIHRARYGSTDL